MIRIQTESENNVVYIVFFSKNLVVTKKQRIFAAHV